MKKYFRHGFTAFLLMAMILLPGTAPLQAQEMKGWGIDAPYNRLYDSSEMDKFKGYVVGIKEIVPMPGMSPGVAIMVKESKADTEAIEVHLCPVWYADKGSTGIKKGDKVKIKGVWASIGEKDIFMASKVKKGDYFEFKVRLTKDGKPFWTMDPEELAREKASR